jgi:hypothetical protein
MERYWRPTDEYAIAVELHAPFRPNGRAIDAFQLSVSKEIFSQWRPEWILSSLFPASRTGWSVSSRGLQWQHSHQAEYGNIRLAVLGRPPDDAGGLSYTNPIGCIRILEGKIFLSSVPYCERMVSWSLGVLREISMKKYIYFFFF